MRELFRIENLPTLQNRVYPTAQEAIDCPLGNVILVQDSKTGLVFNKAFNPLLLVYDHNYQNEQAHSPSFQVHLEQVIKIIERNAKNKTLVEIGCGKGRFLEMLYQRGHDITGIDPAYEGKASNIVPKPFSQDLGIRGDLLILRHVLEHIASPLLFLQDILKNNQGHGLIYIEVPCLDWIIQKRAWFDIFYEHVNYFRMNDFKRIFRNIIECGHLFGGQYIYVLAELSSLRDPQQSEFDSIDFPINFLESVTHHASKLKIENNSKKKYLVWGAASKGVIYSLYMQRSGVTPHYIVDINPAKQGKYIPCSGLLIENPSLAIDKLHKKDIIIVMNSNYIEEIKELTNHNFIYRTIDQ